MTSLHPNERQRRESKLQRELGPDLVALMRDPEVREVMVNPDGLVFERNVPMRSQTPQGVQQELWGALLAYNLVRREREQVAKEANGSPLRIRFIASYRFIRDEFLRCAAARPGAIPAHLKRLRQQLSLFLLPKRRSARRYPISGQTQIQ